ncbi:MAG: PAS domain-containing sensor histidine kinase [Verrucomicrobia bacterium]|nr:PAS domain-containing sensor histidine kinase [Verrucomicrobiota bacterium]
MIDSEIPPEDAIAALVALANSFLPRSNLSRLSAPPTGAETKASSALTQEHYRLLIDQLPVATFMAWFKNGRCELYVSSYIETLLGYTAAEWSENPILWYQRLHPDDRQRWNEEFAWTVASAQPFRGDYRFLARDGRLVWIHGEVKVIYDETGLPFMHGIGYDITELKLIEDGLRESREEAQRASRAKSEFLTRASHELRTPLNIIMGFAEFLLEVQLDPLDPKREEYLQEIYSSGKQLLGLIDDLLDLAQVEAGKMDLRLDKFFVGVAVENVCAGAKTVALKRKINIDVAVSPEIGEVTLDQQKFKQILYNLLSNAIKFTEAGGLVTIRVLPQDAQHFKLVVKDNGIGIKSEDMPRLFQYFEQLDCGPSRRYEGSGLGLALTKGLAELQGGTISIDSHHGVGTTVSVVLPKQIPD